jgi:hypothetical protein
LKLKLGLEAGPLKARAAGLPPCQWAPVSRSP